MISYQVYKMMHFFGLFLLFAGFGFIFVNSQMTTNKAIRLMGYLFHGFGLVLVLTGGFGMLARLGIVQGLPQWVIAKIVLWLLLGVIVSLIKRVPKLLPVWITSTLVLATCAMYLVIYKPM